MGTVKKNRNFDSRVIYNIMFIMSIIAPRNGGSRNLFALKN
jgi:hypothetical protein